MVDLFAVHDSREKFQADTEALASQEGADDAVVALRKLIAEEPLAILYCVDGTYVKASPSILKTTSLGVDPNSSASMTMRDMLQESFKEHLAKNRGDGVKTKNYGVVEVRKSRRSLNGPSFTELCTYSAYVHRIWGLLSSPIRHASSTGRRWLTFPGLIQVSFPHAVDLAHPTSHVQHVILLMNCASSQPAGRNLSIATTTNQWTHPRRWTPTLATSSAARSYRC